jgi:hypothetical protein
MRIYFGKAEYDTNNDYPLEFEGAFKHRNEYFWFYLEYGTNPGGLDEVSITDGCNRIMPISIEHVGELIDALERVRELDGNMKAGADSQKLALSDASESLSW